MVMYRSKIRICVMRVDDVVDGRPKPECQEASASEGGKQDVSVNGSLEGT